MTEAVEFDYVVVGAGSAGCAVAARLSEDPGVTVALVEAGGPDDHPDIAVPLGALELFGSAVDWDFPTLAQPGLGGREVRWPRGRVLGGSSSTNFQMWVPGHAEDFASWHPSWSWDHVRPYFRKAERWAGEPADGGAFGRDGPLWIAPQRDPDPSTARFLDACVAAGLKPVAGGLGGPDNSGCAPTPVTQSAGARWSCADGYLRPAAARPNLTVLTGGPVHRVLLSDGRATGVRLADRILTARREVVLSAGAVGSPHLLLLSGIGDPDELRAAGVAPRVDLPEVGRGLHDHLILDLAVHAPAATRFLEDARDRYERYRMGPLTSNIGEAVAFLRADGGAGPPDLELIWSPMAFGDDGTPLPGYTVGVVLLRPESRGRLTLADTDPATAPRIDPGYLTAEADVRTYTAGVRFAERILDSAALRPLHRGPVAPWPAGDAVADYIRARAQTVFHPVGSCRIGAVVDEHLRVRGVPGLRVVDASVIPEAPRGHTHAHAVMIGERGADLIRRAWKKNRTGADNERPVIPR
ncbi:GMC family oxidoreductase [Actinosynnema sp. CS-041913]|uniref:GMC family oxidoreductase n=1 Tax=Actinosynnema sp. CS-041913 TaxID=3239917 RepID=UPI003D8E3265